MKGAVIGLPEILAIVLFAIVALVVFDLISPYLGLKGPGIGERIIYKMQELFMMPIEDIVLMYHFDEGVGGSITDSSWHGYEPEKIEGAPDSGLRIDEAMIGNGSIYFASTNHYIEIKPKVKIWGKEKNWFKEMIKGELTIDFWIKAEEIVGNVIIDADNFWVRINTDNTVSTSLWLVDGITDCSSGGGRITPNSWTHIAITYTNTTGECKTFINGRLANSEIKSKSIFVEHNDNINIKIGQFRGRMDELRIYSKAVDSAEIVAHFQGLY